MSPLVITGHAQIKKIGCTCLNIKSEKVDPPAKLKNIAFSRPHPEYKNKEQKIVWPEKGHVFTLNHPMIRMFHCVRRTGRGLQKQKIDKTSLMLIPTSLKLLKFLKQHHQYLFKMFGILCLAKRFFPKKVFPRNSLI